MEHASEPHTDDAVHVTVLAFEPGATYDSRGHPCAQCLWRTDSDLTATSDHDMAMLARADGRPRELASFEAPVVDCPFGELDAAQPLPWCAGWLAVIGQHHLAVQLVIAMNSLPRNILKPQATWPPLHSSLAALLEAREEQLQRRRVGREGHG
ncbi:DUF6283 family protein [Streptomyces hokutonensis]|uniref:DUF6283 family protein n=1 Tax=Streptomyces hokutonensis TaxID=1306990 RepID=UPI0003748FBE|nr:DUF6283 family protein [Streptomyces hokutonensis]